MEKIISYPEGKSERKLIFGDLCEASLHGDCEVGDKHRFIFKPSDYMMWKHQIQDYEFNQEHWVIIKEYPEELCHCGIKDSNFQTWILRCDYRGKECNYLEGMNHSLLAKNKSLTEQTEAWKRTATLMPLIFKKVLNYPNEIRAEIIAQIKKEVPVINYSLLGGQKEEKGE